MLDCLHSIGSSRSSSSFGRPPASPVLGVLVGAAVILLADVAAAAAPCVVTEAADDVNLPGALRYCVDQVNQELTDHIVIQAAHWYAPDSPLVFTRSARVSGYGRIVMPGDAWAGSSLFVVGTVCPGPQCADLVTVELEGLELAAMGMTDVRGIEVRAGHGLVLEDASLYDFTVPAGEGGCVRALPQSSLEVVGSTFVGCIAGDGGAVFSSASSTVIAGSTFVDNVAAWNGGAVAIGTSGWFSRSLGVYGTVFEGNAGQWGGAIKASGSLVTVELDESVFTMNSAKMRGGAVYGKGMVRACRFEANESLRGGGLELAEDSTVLDTTLWGNLAREGGGLAFVPGAGGASLWIEGSTLAENVAHGDNARGGGVLAWGGAVSVLNSTLSGNVAKDDSGVSHGGGLSLIGGSKASVAHATFASNHADAGGGIYGDGASGLELLSSIVAYSGTNDCEILGALDSNSSLDTDYTCDVEHAGVDPELDPLADNGGRTWTHWPHASKAQDVAVCEASVDQRGEPRPASDCDIGAVEQ
jgi:hypothetical protein